MRAFAAAVGWAGGAARAAAGAASASAAAPAGAGGGGGAGGAGGAGSVANGAAGAGAGGQLVTIGPVYINQELDWEALRWRLQELARKHPIIGAVHGSGLYLGVELVRDRDTREPAPEETARICDRLLDLGVIMQPTSDRQCVLKVKPPLVLERADADFFVDALDHVLTNGF